MQGGSDSEANKGDIVLPAQNLGLVEETGLSKHTNKHITTVHHKHLKVKIINRKIGDIFIRLGRVLWGKWHLSKDLKHKDPTM